MPAGFDPSQMEEMFKNMTPEQRAQMEQMSQGMNNNGGVDNDEKFDEPTIEEID